MVSVSILEMYAVGFESLVRFPKRANKFTAPVNNASEVNHSEKENLKDHNYSQH